MTMTNTGILELCSSYYDEKKLEHAIRVANQAMSLCQLFKNPCGYWNKFTNFVYQLGLAHDLYEDTNIKQGVWFDDDFEKNLQLLTKEKEVNYNNYVENIRAMAINDSKYMPAYIVKLADMHDHLAQTDTLTEKLKNKYVAAMPYLF